MTQSFYSSGKLLLTGEYVVLSGALSLALPTQRGQWLTVRTINQPAIYWKSYNSDGSLWFEAIYEWTTTGHLRYTAQKNNPTTKLLLTILNSAISLNPNALDCHLGYHVETRLEFSRHWGLGSSSTLINNMADWFEIDPYRLLTLTFGGSGYDIACAQHQSPITYQLINQKPNVKTIDLKFSFLDCLYFVYLNNKQCSKEAVTDYKSLRVPSTLIQEVSQITSNIIECKSLSEFEKQITRHETLISSIINRPKIKTTYFKDFQGVIKSLGAWGGDFILATSHLDPTAYFKSKGFEVVMPYKDMIIHH